MTRVIAGRIVNGDIGVDDMAPTEQDICAEFGVSKTTAREVIGALASRGLVTVRHGRRMEIRPVSEWNHLDPLLLELNHDPESVRRTLGDLHELRLLLEPEIAARAALMATAEQLERMRQALERMEELQDDPTPTSRSTWTFTARSRRPRATSCSRSCSTRCGSSCA